MKMKKAFPVKPYIITCAVVFSLVVAIVFIHSGLTAKDRLASTDLDMFATFEECQQIEANKEAGATVYLASPEYDYALKDLAPVSCYGCDYTSDTMSFQLFAYEFATEEDAAAYFENETGKDDQPAVTYLNSGNPLNFRSIVKDHEKVYRYYCLAKYRDEVTAYVNDCFSVDLIDGNTVNDTTRE